MFNEKQIDRAAKSLGQNSVKFYIETTFNAMKTYLLSTKNLTMGEKTMSQSPGYGSVCVCVCVRRRRVLLFTNPWSCSDIIF